MSVRAFTPARSPLLSDRNVARTKRFAISGSLRQKLSVSFLSKFRSIRVGHDGGCHHLRPPQVIAVEELQKLLDLRLGEAADVIPVIDVAG